MDGIRKILSTQLSEREVIIYLLVESGNHTYRSLADDLGLSVQTVGNIYNSAKDKMEMMANLGQFQTPVYMP